MEVNARGSTNENKRRWFRGMKRDGHIGEPHQEEQREGFQTHDG